MSLPEPFWQRGGITLQGACAWSGREYASLYVTVGKSERVHLWPSSVFPINGGWTLCGLWADALVVFPMRDNPDFCPKSICKRCLALEAAKL